MKKTSIIFATGNEHKVLEVNHMLRNLPYEIISMKSLGFTDDVEETGETFTENAWIKAHDLYQKNSSNCFAEDSGLVIDALNGEPGIYSARYAGQQRNHDHNIEKVLKKLHGVDNRNARFVSVIALIYEDKEYTFEGIAEGTIAVKRLGNGGFGYDPIFIPENYSYSFGQLPEATKSHISHRGKSIESMISFLSKLQE